jgi:hypothetical protein
VSGIVKEQLHSLAERRHVDRFARCPQTDENELYAGTH